jgi:short-subunit dehydrogenase
MKYVNWRKKAADMFFKNKVIWITGASSGIGEHLAYALAKEGARLVLSSRNEKELERVSAGCVAGAEVHIVPLDVTDLDAVAPVAAEIARTIGPVDILINNAGISQRDLALKTSLAVDRKIMEVNYFGTLAITRAVAADMQARKSGHIVVMSSVLGKMGVPYRSAYAASKHALHGFFDSLRAELYRDGIKVTLICPGYVFTNVTANALKGDGTPNAVIEESTRAGFPPDVFAKKALKAIRQCRREVVIAKTEGLGVLLQRFVPGIYARIARNMKLK